MLRGELLLLLLLGSGKVGRGNGRGGHTQYRQRLFRVAGLRRIRRCRVTIFVAVAVAVVVVGIVVVVFVVSSRSIADGRDATAADAVPSWISVLQQHLFSGNGETADDGVLDPRFGNLVRMLV